MRKQKNETFTINRLSGKLGIDPRTLKRWFENTEPAAHQNGNPAYTLEQSAEAIRINRERKNGKSSSRERLLSAQADRAEFQVQVLRGEYVLATDVEKWAFELASAVRKIVLQIHLVAPSVVGVPIVEAEDILKEKEVEILTQFHTISERAESYSTLRCPHCDRNIAESPAECTTQSPHSP
jgi:phage terminase Nu1 subunit (DNA packaging protein)